MFAPVSDSRPSLKILNALYEHDDFMESIRTMVDLGCGNGDDLEWWATRTTRDEGATPLNIRCVGVDLQEQLPVAHKHANATYQRTDFETVIHPPSEMFDVLWCHDSFQYCKQPMQTLHNWQKIASNGAMLILAVPETISWTRGKLNCFLPPMVPYNHTMISLIYMLSCTGWDCSSGFFYQQSYEPWIRAVVYKGTEIPEKVEYKTWYELAESGRLPESAKRSIDAHGYLRQQDLVVQWLDHNLYWLGK